MSDQGVLIPLSEQNVQAQVVTRGQWFSRG